MCFILAFSGCSLNRIAVRSTSGILFHSFEALLAEDDLVLAQTAIESDLKLVEGLIRSDPSNSGLLLLASQGFASYALAFVEDENPERAKRLYLRGRDYAMKWISMQYDVNLLALENLDDFILAVQNLPPKAVPGVFWAGNSWASAMLLSLSDVQSIASLPRGETMMQFVLDYDETYYYAGAHLFFCGYYGGRPKMLGGDPVKAEFHIDRHKELTGGDFLLGDYFRVKYIALPALDEISARRTLLHVQNYDLEKAPSIRLVNAIAKKKAVVLLENVEDYL
ncbi:TRAP transporter TatT component family protein [Calditrichota bacterium]